MHEFCAAGDLLLVKGSRGVKMERIVEAIERGMHRSGRRKEQPRRSEPAERTAAEMLYYLFFYVLRPHFSPLNVFRYITVRTAVASLTALLLSLLLGPWMIERLRDMQVEQYIREEGPKAHQAKAGTPTMGGVLIVAAIVVPTLLWADLRNPYVLLALAAMMAFGAIGFVDDYNKVVRRRNLGLTARRKFLLQVLTCVVVGAVLLWPAGARRLFDAVERAVLQAAASRPRDRLRCSATVHSGRWPSCRSCFFSCW